MKQNEYSLKSQFVIDLKKHPYFNGIDWNQVAEKTCKPPFKPKRIEYDDEERIDLVERLNINANEKIDETILERLRSKLNKINANIHWIV